ncbi:unnamed protein product [Orchesella dallaii]|uniref:Secreted protein n=1 Tax=Orchesella dallaii TaxID=48710 RepID=A0ABP1R2P7_9HEXA
MNRGIVVVAVLVMLLCGSIGAFPTGMPESSDVHSNRPPKMTKVKAAASSDQLADHHHKDHATWVENITNMFRGLPTLPLTPEKKFIFYINLL